MFVGGREGGREGERERERESERERDGENDQELVSDHHYRHARCCKLAVQYYAVNVAQICSNNASKCTIYQLVFHSQEDISYQEAQLDLPVWKLMPSVLLNDFLELFRRFLRDLEI